MLRLGMLATAWATLLVLGSSVRQGKLDVGADLDMQLLLDGQDENPFHPMIGRFTSSKLIYDPLTRYSTSGIPLNGTLIMRLLEAAAKANPDEVALRQPYQDADGNLITKGMQYATNIAASKFKYMKITWQEYYDLVMDAAAAFLSMGLKPMDAVNIRGVNSPEWLITFLGCIAAGGLPVGLYPTDSLDTLEFKAKDSGAKFIVLGKAKDLQLYSTFLNKDEFSSVKAVVLWDVNPQHPEPLGLDVLEQLNTPERPLILWDQFLAKGHGRVAANFKEQVKQRVASQHPGMAGSVVYTSGTTGNPKGVLLSQDGLTSSAMTMADEILTETPKDGQLRTVSYLPLNHVAGQMLDVIAPLVITAREKGVYSTVYFPAKCFLKKTCFKEQLVDAQPTVFLGVPEVWDGLKLKIEDASRSTLMNMIKEHSPRTLLKGVGLGSVMYALSGAGPITKPTLSFFHNMGLNILNVYAQSESSCLGTAWKNSDYENFDLGEKFGSIGRPVGNKLRLVNTNDQGEGEIELWGRNVMLGYLNRDDKTNEAITHDGWLKTGDQGRMDKDGFVFLTGRSKEIMKDKGGEMIAPVAVEEGIKQSCNKPGRSIVKQAVVVGDGKYYISALLTVVEEAKEGIPTGNLAGAAKLIDPVAKTVAQAAQSPTWAAELSACIAAYNKKAAKSQQRIFRYAMLPRDITAEDSPDLMTPTFKIKRKGVSETYEEVIARCGGDAPLQERVVKACGSK
mmetsp:Transcript_87046/g.186566  ORF Transcript_87046/g.186566 Transcript_87046/m.186566 type:complete len:733 (+) Transcript_87046:53-2251(+)